MQQYSFRVFLTLTGTFMIVCYHPQLEPHQYTAKLYLLVSFQIFHHNREQELALVPGNQSCQRDSRAYVELEPLQHWLLLMVQTGSLNPTQLEYEATA